MTWSAFAFIITGVLLNAVAQLALKASVHEMGAIVITLDSLLPVAWRLARQPWLWAGLGCYGVSVAVWILALSRVDVTIAYPMLSIGYVVSAIAAWLLFGEVLTAGRLTGIGIIMVGVCVLAKS